MWARVDDRRPFTAALIGLIFLAWLVLLAWGQSPYARVLSHEQPGACGRRRAAQRSHWLGDHAWAIGGATLLLAGVYQFTPLKYHCLDKCRSPFSFISERWGGSRDRLAGVRLRRS